MGLARRSRAVDSGSGMAAGSGVFKFLPHASNKLLLDFEILRKGLNDFSFWPTTQKLGTSTLKVPFFQLEYSDLNWYFGLKWRISCSSSNSTSEWFWKSDLNYPDLNYLEVRFILPYSFVGVKSLRRDSVTIAKSFFLALFV